MKKRSDETQCGCCPAPAKFDLHGTGYACGRHLAYMIRVGQFGEQEVKVKVTNISPYKGERL